MLNAGCGGHPVRRPVRYFHHVRQNVGPTQSIKYRRSFILAPDTRLDRLRFAHDRGVSKRVMVHIYRLPYPSGILL